MIELHVNLTRDVTNEHDFPHVRSKYESFPVFYVIYNNQEDVKQDSSYYVWKNGAIVK